MYIRNRTAALVFRLFILVSGGVGCFINLGFNDGVFFPSALIYYTNLSNIVCFLFFIPLTYRTATYSQSFLPRVKGMCTLLITVTIIVYHFILAGGVFRMYSDNIRPAFYFSNLLMHYVTPTLVILDWLLFSPKRAFKLYDPLIWTIPPILYVIGLLVRAEIGGVIVGVGSRFPYFFLNIDRIGWDGMLGYVAAISVGFLLLGYTMVALDKFLPDRNRKHFV
jgi:hypothetical protein